ncbi:hypothetical protein [Nitriliruptor alkaliphilus]|uniref:hypothetical protein n=1 Tax=Nitriliruptor alkaliphilus TaxID=427918 RepID=UPI0006983731|nr:hypothetical protein [Nitriliruptor alkaliphilus]
MRTTSAAPATRQPSHARPVDDDLTTLLDEVGRTDLSAPAWEVLARRARLLTSDLADRGLLPPHLVVAPTDPPVVAARLLAAAWGHASAAADPTPLSVRAACA